MNGKIEALVFDMDGLLFDSERVVQRSWNITGEEMGYGKIGEHIYHTLGMNLKSRTEYFKKVYGPDFPMDKFSVETRRNFYKIADEEGVPLKRGALALLQYAKAKGYKTAIATSSRRDYATRQLAAGGIKEYFDGFVYGDMVTNSKPDPEIYLKACEQIGVSPENALALEDAPNGIRAAHAAGLRPIMVPDLVRPTDEIKAMTYLVLESLKDVIDILDRMNEGGVE